MRVLHLAPLWYPISRDAPGGIETFLFRLVSALKKGGCAVSLIGSGDSEVEAELVPVVPEGLYSQMAAGRAAEYVYYEQHQLALAIDLCHEREFDVIHSHIGPAAYALSAVTGIGARVLHTVHTPVYRDMEWFVSRHPNIRLSAVSEWQSRKLREAGAADCCVIPNGIDVEDFTFSDKPGGGLLFVGRMERAKGADIAVRVARELGLPLTLAGPIVEREFFEESVASYLDGQIRYLGVVDHAGKNVLLGQAKCMLLPFRVEEPFGMVSLEAMACGTPVVALSKGALPEIVEPSLTGYLAQDETELGELLLRAMELDRAEIRARGAERFGIERTAELYYRLYREIAANAIDSSEGARVC
ncbi:MAG: glycosyltransferase family 4 protein [Chloroflexia bacterium]